MNIGIYKVVIFEIIIKFGLNLYGFFFFDLRINSDLENGIKKYL